MKSWLHKKTSISLLMLIIILILSAFINLLYLINYITPKSADIYFWSNDVLDTVYNNITGRKDFRYVGYITNLNYEYDLGKYDFDSEFFMIFSPKNSTLDSKTVSPIYVIGWEHLQNLNDWLYPRFFWWVNPVSEINFWEPRRLIIKSIDNNKIEIEDDKYSFDIYKTGKISWKTIDWKIFELTDNKKFNL